MGGDHIDIRVVGEDPPGSPPHGRGPRSARRAGAAPRRAHPRMGGDHLLRLALMRVHGGSPPHGRGPPFLKARRGVALGLTPAWAGTTSIGGSSSLIGRAHPAWAGTTPSRHPASRNGKAHPRMGGDHYYSVDGTGDMVGSPPHGRGPLTITE